MSRWTREFKEHSFQKPWAEILIFCKEHKPTSSQNVGNLLELARFKKVVKFIDEAIDGFDLELVPSSIWNDVGSNANSCIQELNNYQSNSNISNLKSANQHLDNILIKISPYIVLTGKSARSMRASLREYTKTISANTELLASRLDNALKDLNAKHDEASNLAIDAVNQLSKIDELYKQCFVDTDDKDAIKTRLNTLSEEIENWHDTFSDYITALKVGSDTEESIIIQVSEAKKEVLENAKSSEANLNKIKETLSELSEFHSKIFGQPNEKGVFEGGLKDEIDKRRRDIGEFDNDQKVQYEALKDRIEGLLPGATSAGLAKAYNDLKLSFAKPIETYSWIFYGAIVGIFLVALLFATKSVGWLYIEFMDLGEPAKLGSNLVVKLPLLVPLVWLAVFASKRRSECQRLQQEYAHKGALAASYQGFKQQIEELGEEDPVLMAQLLEKTINTIAKNASETLDGKHGDKPPIQELAEKVVPSKPRV